MTIQEAIQKIRDNKDDPHVLADIRLELGAEYAFLSAQLEDILLEKAGAWISFREAAKSTVAADREWESSESGRRELSLKIRLKTVEKLMSAIKTKLEMSKVEGANYY